LVGVFGGVPARQGFDVFFADRDAVFRSEQVLQENLERERKAPGLGQDLLDSREPENSVLLAAYRQRALAPEAIRHVVPSCARGIATSLLLLCGKRQTRQQKSRIQAGSQFASCRRENVPTNSAQTCFTIAERSPRKTGIEIIRELAGSYWLNTLE